MGVFSCRWLMQAERQFSRLFPPDLGYLHLASGGWLEVVCKEPTLILLRADVLRSQFEEAQWLAFRIARAFRSCEPEWQTSVYFFVRTRDTSGGLLFTRIP